MFIAASNTVRRRLALAVCACSALVLLSQAKAQGYLYVGVTEAATARTGAVSAGGLTWQCAGNRCTITGPWEAPSVTACEALARAVGRLRSYGRDGAELSAKQMAQCNKGGSSSAGTGAARPVAGAGSNAAVAAARASSSVTLPEISAPFSAKPSGIIPRLVTELTAETVAPTHRQGTVRTGGLSWSCQGSRCTATGQTKLTQCFSLAREVGRIRSYVGPSGSLSRNDLDICNGPRLLRLEISARSGDDDLRQGSSLTADIASRNGPEVARPVFSRLASNAYDTARIPMTGTAPLDALSTYASVNGLERITLVFRSGSSGNPFDSADNWDMRELQIVAVMQDLDGGTRRITLRDSRPRTAVVKRFSDGDTLETRIGRDELR